MKLLCILSALGAGIWAAYNIIPVYKTEWEVQDVFDTIVKNLSKQSATVIRAKLPDLLHAEYIDRNDLPIEFYDHLQIKTDGHTVKISSAYHVTLWLLGPPENTDSDEGYTAGDLKGMDKLRDKARLDYHFGPFAVTP